MQFSKTLIDLYNSLVDIRSIIPTMTYFIYMKNVMKRSDIQAFPRIVSAINNSLISRAKITKISKRIPHKCKFIE